MVLKCNFTIRVGLNISLKNPQFFVLILEEMVELMPGGGGIGPLEGAF